MKAIFMKIDKDSLACIERNWHGIGEIDCEFKHVWDVVNHYSKKYDKLPIQIADNAFMFEDSESWIYINIEDIFKFNVGNIVRSNNNFSTMRFGRSEIVKKYMMNFYPRYIVKFSDGTTRDCREVDLIQCCNQFVYR